MRTRNEWDNRERGEDIDTMPLDLEEDVELRVSPVSYYWEPLFREVNGLDGLPRV